MRALSSRAAQIIGATLFGTVCWAIGPAAAMPAGDRSAEERSIVTASDDPEDSLRRALELERERKWTAAIELYEDALDHWPDRADLSRLRVDFVHRLRLCESHYRLGRRYQDQSFRNTLLRLPRERVLDLFDEVLERIESQYVETVALEPLLRRGFDNLEVALRDPTFLQANAPEATAERVQRLRDHYRQQRDRIVARDRPRAKALVATAGDLGRQTLGLSAAAVALEFVYGACDGLNDDYSAYLTPDKLDDLYAVIEGNFVGLGVELKQDEQGLKIVGVIPGGPAADALLKPGDRIVEIDGRSVVGLGLDEAAGRLQGTEGSLVEVVLLRNDGTQERKRLARRAVEVRSISQSKLVDPANKVGYIQLTGFQKSSTDELTRAIVALQRQGMTYLVLDLRGNPGGLLNVAVEIGERFIDRGVLVSTSGRAVGQSYIYKAKGQAIWTMPMAVLIDHDSASASEILAGALQDHRRAIVVGDSTSYGKGSVQSIFALRSAPAGLKLTTAKFYSPRNRPYSEQGVEPDLKVRVAAKPRANDESLDREEFGDPERDVVLNRALQQARQQLAKGR